LRFAAHFDEKFILMKNLTEKYRPYFIPALVTRFIAAFIDMFILSTLFILLRLLFVHKGADGQPEPASISITGGCIFFVAAVLLVPVSEGLTGRTIGKRIMRLRVVNIDFSPVTLSASFIRHVMDVIDWSSFGLVAFLVAYANKYHRRIGDFFAMTMVVKADEELPE
jgi:uncharacterized RDD family membrane protein YckC